MKGDFSRIRFNPSRQYSSVLKQQGRVDLDADSNEQRFIDERMRTTINTDVIGRWGAPEDDAGFAIEISGNDILIGPGRFYADGILVENPSAVPYDKQPWLIEPSSSAQDLLDQLLRGGHAGSLSFVLEVWQRMVTALDDCCLVEPALDRADTTTRLQTVWRVIGTYDSGESDRIAIHEKSSPAPSDGSIEYNPATSTNSPINQLSPCCQTLYGKHLRGPLHGEMGADVVSGGSDCGCQPLAAAGYQGLENQLYRVEIHQGGDLSSATFKWSRENASVVARITNVSGKKVTVDSLGHDANLGLQPDQWVELTDETYEFGDTPNQPGTLFKIVSVDPTLLQVTLDSPVYGIDQNRKARMRRWDQPVTAGTSDGIPVSENPIALEDGIEVSFRGREFQSGDYWTIPARTANGEIDWPPCGGGKSFFQPADFVHIHHAPLACVKVRSRIDYIYRKGITGTAQDKTQVNDCRLLFPPLTYVNANTVPGALHITAVSWTNDDVMTVDSLVENGLSVTFDQPTTCAWGGGNFQVYFEPPFTAADQIFNRSLAGMPSSSFKFPAGTDAFLRTVMALDPPWGISVSGNQVIWMPPFSAAGQVNQAAFVVWYVLNELLKYQTPAGYGRVRVRLISAAVFGSSSNGNIYLDGQSFGSDGIRTTDGSDCVNLTVPSGDSLAVSDYESWFYLAPSVFVASVVIQGVNNGQTINITALKVVVNAQNQVIALQIGESNLVTKLQATITLSYAPISMTVVKLAFASVSGGNPAGVVSITSAVEFSAGQLTATTPIDVVGNPGGGNTVVVNLNAAVTILGMPSNVSAPPQLSIAGMTPPNTPPPAPPAPPSPIIGKLPPLKFS
jgi:Family of unknown function (DUF6519)